MKRTFAALALICCATAASAQDPSYQPWRPAGDTAAATEELLRELTAMTDAAERDRAASPDFLADLRRLIARYREAWPVVWFHDDFADGDFAYAPAWTVFTGQWTADPSSGLRSDARPTAARTQTSESPSPEQLAVDLLGVFLDQHGARPVDEPSVAPPLSTSGEATIGLPRPLSNAFSITLDLVDLGGAGLLEARVYQTPTREPGYRLVYQAAPDPSFAIYRRSRSGTVMIGETVVPVRLTPGVAAPVVWSRDQVGDMTVSVDNEIVLRASDTLFRDDWDGFLLRNAGGYFSLRSVTAAGTG